MFWGLALKDTKPHELKMAKLGILHLSEACLGPNSDSGKIYLQMQVDGEIYNLCALQKDKWESHKLDHYITFDDSAKKYKLIVSGSGKVDVHVTGFVEIEENEDLVDEREVKDKKEKVKAKKVEEDEEIDLDDDDEEEGEEDDEDEENEEDEEMDIDDDESDEIEVPKKQPAVPDKQQNKPSDNKAQNKPVDEKKVAENKTKPETHKTETNTSQQTPQSKPQAKKDKDELDDDIDIKADSDDSLGEDNINDDDLLMDDDEDEINKLLSDHRQKNPDQLEKMQKLDDQSKKPTVNQQQNKGGQKPNKGGQQHKGGNQQQNKGNQNNKGGNPNQQNKGGNQQKGGNPGFNKQQKGQ
jgi:hypothetical protein